MSEVIALRQFYRIIQYLHIRTHIPCTHMYTMFHTGLLLGGGDSICSGKGGSLCVKLGVFEEKNHFNFVRQNMNSGGGKLNSGGGGAGIPGCPTLYMKRLPQHLLTYRFKS